MKFIRRSWKVILGIVGALLVMLILFANIAGNSVGRTFEESSDTLMYAAEPAPSMGLADTAELFRVSNQSMVEVEVTRVVSDLATSQDALNPAQQERLIIRNGHLDIVVADTEMAIADISDLTVETGGWVVESRSNQFHDGLVRGNMTIRIPAEQFDAIIAEIKAGAIEVQGESSSGQDVTEEYVDLSARLRNLEATADRVRSFLDDAVTVEEALAVNVELGRLDGEIEAIKGRLQYLSESAAFSSVSISITPDEANQPIEVAGWQPQGVARESIEALIEGLQVLANVVIWLMLFAIPMLLVIGIPGYFIVRWITKLVRRMRNNSGSEAELAYDDEQDEPTTA